MKITQFNNLQETPSSKSVIVTLFPVNVANKILCLKKLLPLYLNTSIFKIRKKINFSPINTFRAFNIQNNLRFQVF